MVILRFWSSGHEMRLTRGSPLCPPSCLVIAETPRRRLPGVIGAGVRHAHSKWIPIAVKRGREESRSTSVQQAISTGEGGGIGKSRKHICCKGEVRGSRRKEAGTHKPRPWVRAAVLCVTTRSPLQARRGAPGRVAYSTASRFFEPVAFSLPPSSRIVKRANQLIGSMPLSVWSIMSAVRAPRHVRLRSQVAGIRSGLYVARAIGMIDIVEL